MNEIELHILDTSNITADSLYNLPFLKTEDFEEFERYKTDIGKKEKAISAYFKRKYIGEYSLNENGKPIAKDIYFNVSHSNGIVIFAKYSTPIGVDIEHIESKDEDIKRYITNDEEYSKIQNDEDFFSIWVSKESLVKANGSGLKDIKTIPALPYDGIKQYEGEKYYSHLLKINDYFISVTILDLNDFIIKTIIEGIRWKKIFTIYLRQKKACMSHL